MTLSLHGGRSSEPCVRQDAGVVFSLLFLQSICRLVQHHVLTPLTAPKASAPSMEIKWVPNAGNESPALPLQVAPGYSFALPEQTEMGVLRMLLDVVLWLVLICITGKFRISHQFQVNLEHQKSAQQKLGGVSLKWR